MDAAIVTEILRRLRDESQTLGLSPAEFFELMLRTEDFKVYLDRLGENIVEGLRKPAFGPPPLLGKGGAQAQRSAWPKRKPGDMNPSTNIYGTGA